MNDIRITKDNTLALKRREVMLSKGETEVTISLLDAVKALVNGGFRDLAVSLDAGETITEPSKGMTFKPLWS